MLRIDINLVYIIINILILYFLLKKFLIKPLDNILAQRQAKVDGMLNNASTRESEALQLKDTYVGKARETVALEREKAMREMEAEVAGLALTAAEKILRDKSGAASDQLLYDQFLEAGDSDDTDLN